MNASGIPAVAAIAPRSIDLNADLGEGFGAYTMGDDAGLLEVVSSANVACGMHAGDPDTMARVFAAARERGVRVGAHPGFADLHGFGRRDIPCSAGEIERLVAYQLGAAQALSALAGHPVRYVKAHGALAHRTFVDVGAARAFARAVRAVDPTWMVLTLCVGPMAAAAENAGLRVASEVFADRGYADDGTLLPRAAPGAVLHDPKEVAARALRMAATGAVETASGRARPTSVDSICVHGDTPGALAMAREIRTALECAGFLVRPFASQ